MTAYAATSLDGLAMGVVLFAITAGLALILGAADLLNLAHGSFYLLGAVIGWRAGDGTWSGLAAAAAIAIAIGAAAGLLLQLVLQPLIRAGHLRQALATIGIGLLVADTMSLATGGQAVVPQLPAALQGSVTVAGVTYPLYRLVFVAAALPPAAALWWLVERSRAGLLVRAAATDAPMVQTLGVPPQLLLAGALSVGSAVAVTAGAFAAPIIAGAPGIDQHLLVSALTVIVLGGITSLRAIFTASLVLGQVDTLGVAIWPQTTAFAVLGLLIAAVTLRTRNASGPVAP